MTWCVRPLWLLAPALLAACSYEPRHPHPFDPDRTDASAIDVPAPGDSPTEATSDVIAVDATVDVDIDVDVAIDATADSKPPAPDMSGPAPCLPRSPSVMFNATPAGTCGSVCNINGALAPGGAVAGLECTGSGSVLIDGRYVTACIGADFGGPMNVDPVVIRIASAASACGTACGTECGTGHNALVFQGQVRGVYRFAADLAITAALRDYQITLGQGSRYVVVCRGGSGAHRDDITVDSIASHAGCM